ncbi:ribosomal protein L1 [Russula earlei]|uniref:Ribosomal protein L1 n=1 Tax=Russula earlei TaxID=71964 RepID=A0ACC0UK88_9AGAM|nr:ribosomal protein L1 [Russula earlei]
MSFLQLCAPRSAVTLGKLPGRIKLNLNPLHPISRAHFHCRCFSTSHVVLARHAKATGVRTSKKRPVTSIYDAEKMTLADAIHVLRALEVGSGNATYELTIKTAMPRGSAIPKGRVSLPREPKAKPKDKILVFADGKAADEAKRAGADIVGGAELVEGVASGRIQATLFIATPALIKSISQRLGRVLGPRGLMPSERRGTVTDDAAGYIRRLQGTTEWKGDKTGTIRTPIAKLDYPVEDVVRNVRHFISVVKHATGNQAQSADKDRSAKPVNAITKIILSSRQGPGIHISDI